MGFLLNLVLGLVSYGILALATYNISTDIIDIQSILSYPMALAGLIFFAGLSGHVTVLYLHIRSRRQKPDQPKAEPGRIQPDPVIRLPIPAKDPEKNVEKNVEKTFEKNTDRSSDSPSVPASAEERQYPRLEPVTTEPSPRSDDTLANHIKAAITEGRLDVVMQPIVSLPQRKTLFFECFSRIRTKDGTVLEPSDYIPVVARTGLIPEIDDSLLFRCVRLARQNYRRNRGIGFFCNLSTSSLRNPRFVSEFFPFLTENKPLSKFLFLEFKQDDFAQLDQNDSHRLTQLASMGFRYSIDHISRLDISPALLYRHHIKFLKAPIDLLLENPEETRQFKTELNRRGIDLIADRIEKEEDLIRLLDQSIDYGQGFLFGPPRPSRENIPLIEATSS